MLLTFNARNEHDRTKFCEDLRESILEMDEMEALRIDAELERQKANGARHGSVVAGDGAEAGVGRCRRESYVMKEKIALFIWRARRLYSYTNTSICV